MFYIVGVLGVRLYSVELSVYNTWTVQWGLHILGPRKTSVSRRREAFTLICGDLLGGIAGFNARETFFI